MRAGPAVAIWFAILALIAPAAWGGRSGHRPASGGAKSGVAAVRPSATRSVSSRTGVTLRTRPLRHSRFSWRTGAASHLWATCGRLHSRPSRSLFIFVRAGEGPTVISAFGTSRSWRSSYVLSGGSWSGGHGFGFRTVTRRPAPWPRQGLLLSHDPLLHSRQGLPHPGSGPYPCGVRRLRRGWPAWEGARWSGLSVWFSDGWSLRLLSRYQGVRSGGHRPHRSAAASLARRTLPSFPLCPLRGNSA